MRKIQRRPHHCFRDSGARPHVRRERGACCRGAGVHQRAPAGRLPARLRWRRRHRSDCDSRAAYGGNARGCSRQGSPGRRGRPCAVGRHKGRASACACRPGYGRCKRRWGLGATHRRGLWRGVEARHSLRAGRSPHRLPRGDRRAGPRLDSRCPRDKTGSCQAHLGRQDPRRECALRLQRLWLWRRGCHAHWQCPLQ